MSYHSTEWRISALRPWGGLIDNKTDYFLPAPAIGAALNVAPWKWADCYFEVSGLPLGQYGHTLNVEGGLKIIPIKNASVEVGYRYSDISYENHPDFIKMKFAGPFAAATLRF